MAICKDCGVEKARFMSDLCGTCISKPPSNNNASAQRITSDTAAVPTSSEGGMASSIGSAVIWLSLIASIVCVFTLGRITIPDGLYGTKQIWSSTLVAAILAAGLNGAFFGYALAKIGSVLKHLESIRGIK